MKSASLKKGELVLDRDTGLVYAVASDHVSTNDRVYVERATLHKVGRFGPYSAVNQKKTQIARSKLTRLTSFEASLAVFAEKTIAGKQKRNEKEKTAVILYKSMIASKGINPAIPERLFGGAR